VTVPELGSSTCPGRSPGTRNGNLVGEGDYAKQAEQIVINLDIALASAGAPATI
jgi:enamine deaminase RidA (YjgF/YER057c/UK114 family)